LRYVSANALTRTFTEPRSLNPQTRSENLEAIDDLVSTFETITRIFQSYESSDFPRTIGLAAPVDMNARVSRFRWFVSSCSEFQRELKRGITASVLIQVREEWEINTSEGIVKQHLDADRVSADLKDLNTKIVAALSGLQVSSIPQLSVLYSGGGTDSCGQPWTPRTCFWTSIVFRRSPTRVYPRLTTRACVALRCREFAICD
jgi:hypothetical protein